MPLRPSLRLLSRQLGRAMEGRYASTASSSAGEVVLGAHAAGTPPPPGVDGRANAPCCCYCPAVLCIDPRTVLQRAGTQLQVVAFCRLPPAHRQASRELTLLRMCTQELLRDETQFTRLTVPASFLPQLSQVRAALSRCACMCCASTGKNAGD